MGHLNVLIHGPGVKHFIPLFESRKGYGLTADWACADAVLFTGGPDVEPRLYQDKLHSTTHFVRDRDKFDRNGYIRAKKADLLMIGVCRGAQFLNVMNGGALFQDVDNHVTSHDAVSPETGEVWRVTSTHHQMMIPTPQAELLLTAKEASYKCTGSARFKNPSEADTEAVWYSSTKSFCFQPHPEMDPHGDTASCFFTLLERIRAA